MTKVSNKAAVSLARRFEEAGGPSAAVCTHCQEPLPVGILPENLKIGEHSFCCEGCKMVYEILNANDLCQFYDFNGRNGHKIDLKHHQQSFAWLDDPDTVQKLTQFNDGKLAKVSFRLPDMHCAACIWLLEHLYRLDKGVLRSTVNFPKQTVSIDFNPGETSLRRLAAMLASIGYPPEISLADTEDNAASRRAVPLSLYYKMGVAGFVTGNSMLLSFPEYLGLQQETDGWYFSIFGYLNFLLALPVLFYSSRDYLLSAWNGLKNGHLNIDLPVSLGIIMLFGRSAYEILSGTGAGYMDSFSALVFFLLCGKWFQQSTFHKLSFERDFRSYFPVAATLKLGDGSETTVPLSNLKPGNIILIRNGELVPADGVLSRGTANMDYSFVTGEAAPVEVKTGEKIFAGGKQCGDMIEVALTRTVSQSYLTQLWNDEAFKTPKMGHASQLADMTGKWFTWFLLALDVACLAYWWGYKGDIATAVNTFTAVFMVACPCAIAVSIPFTLGNVQRLLSRNRFYLKNTRVLESLSDIQAVVFDKTGTITSSEYSDEKGDQLAFVAAQTQQSGKISAMLQPLDMIAIKSLTYRSSHPASRLIYGAFSADVPVEKVVDYQDITGQGISGTVNGRRWQVGSAHFVLGAEMTASERPKGVYISVDQEVLGYFDVRGRYRSGLRSVLDYFRQIIPVTAHKPQVYLLSGDHAQERQNLSAYFTESDSMHFEKSPHQKLEFIRALRQDGRKVLFMGDGLNDAGALREAEVGIVVSENTNNFTPASDAVLHADEFERLPQFLKFAGQSIQLVKISFLIALMYNIGGLTYAVTGQLSPIVAAILMPVSSVTLVLIGMLGSHWLAYRANLLTNTHGD